MTEQEFRLSENLEQLINDTNFSDSLHLGSLRTPDDMRVRDQAENFYRAINNRWNLGADARMLKRYSAAHFVDSLADTKQLLVQKLDSMVDDVTYNSAKGKFVSGLKEFKENYYVNLLENGIMPNEPVQDAEDNVKASYNQLRAVRGVVDLAAKLKLHAAKGDVRAALAEMAQYAHSTGKQPFTVAHLRSLDRMSAYGGPAARESESQIIDDIADTQKAIAGEMIKQGNLYSLIESGISTTPNGKGIALKSMYGTYKKQEEFNRENAAQSTGSN